MSPEEQLRIVGALARVARAPLLAHFEPRSCIASTRIGLDVLDYFGIHAEALPLFVLMLNDEALELSEQGVSQVDLAAEMQRHGTNDAGGPWAIGLGAEIEGSCDWAGHLMIALPQLRVLLDLSLDQASRPHKGLPIEPEGHVFPIVSDDWWQGRERRTALTARTGPRAEHQMALILDRNCRKPDGYKRSANWHRTGGQHGRAVFQAVTGEIIRLVKDELDSDGQSPQPDQRLDQGTTTLKAQGGPA